VLVSVKAKPPALNRGLDLRSARQPSDLWSGPEECFAEVERQRIAFFRPGWVGLVGLEVGELVGWRVCGESVSSKASNSTVFWVGLGWPVGLAAKEMAAPGGTAVRNNPTNHSVISGEKRPAAGDEFDMR
jgi:hypothetical protein